MVSHTLFKQELEAKPRSPENEVKAAGSMNLSLGQGQPKPQREREEIPGERVSLENPLLFCCSSCEGKWLRENRD